MAEQKLYHGSRSQGNMCLKSRALMALIKTMLHKTRTATVMDGTLHTDFRKSETSRDIKKKI